ncbi:MAG TPA: DUF4260 domain-containing protein [Rhizomicrobium sp.]|nr:DUF4260 domain-containing protein [Rhizomicrobium sp.]
MSEKTQGFVTGGPKAILQLEGLAMLLAAVGLYYHLGASWKMFAILFLAPDLSFVFFLIGPRVGAVAYNMVHSTIGPLIALAVGFFLFRGLWPAIGLIWLSHVGFDRALGFGLKYGTAFGDSHLGQLGRRKGVAGMAA